MAVDATADVNGGRMNGFITSVESGHLDTDRLGCHVPITDPPQRRFWPARPVWT